MLSLSKSEREQGLVEITVQELTAAGRNGLLGSSMADLRAPDIYNVP